MPPRHSNAPYPQIIDRIQDSLLAGLEKRTLIWIATRLPPWVTPDALTWVGFLSLIFAGGLYATGRLDAGTIIAINVLITLNWFGDSLDGTLARVRNKQRPRYGFYIDHITDAVGTSALLLGMGLSGAMRFGIATLLLAVYLVLFIHACLATYVAKTFRISYARMSTTELRIVLVALNFALLYAPPFDIGGVAWTLFDVVGLLAIAAISAVTTIEVARLAIRLDREESQALLAPSISSASRSGPAGRSKPRSSKRR